MVTTSPRVTCPAACLLRKSSGTDAAGGCYAEHGFLGGFIWTKLDRLEPGQTFKAGQMRVYDLPQLLAVIRELPDATLWRHNQAGDLFSIDQETIDEETLAEIVSANRGRSGFTYTHYDVLSNAHNRRVIRQANENGFTVNLSANNLDEADSLADLRIGPVAVVLPAQQRANVTTASGRKVIICPAIKHPGMTCATCGICSKHREAIVGLPAVGAGATRAEQAVIAA
ncbi:MULTISPECIES: hypothetical protein [Jannaschia]|nr:MULTISPECIES: hypothetical protein [unclassified Jannaschia]